MSREVVDELMSEIKRLGCSFTTVIVKGRAILVMCKNPKNIEGHSFEDKEYDALNTIRKDYTDFIIRLVHCARDGVVDCSTVISFEDFVPVFQRLKDYWVFVH